MNAGLQDLVERGIADAERAVIAGYSWGGYVTLLESRKASGPVALRASRVFRWEITRPGMKTFAAAPGLRSSAARRRTA